MSREESQTGQSIEPPQDEEHQPQHPPFPHHDEPRVWFITAGESPIAILLAKQLIEHGDYVISCVSPFGHESENGVHRYEELKNLLNDLARRQDDSSKRMKVISSDIRSVADCQAIVAEALKAFERVDVLLCCSSEVLMGTIEELSQSARTQSLVNDQFAANFFSAVNIIKAFLPSLRSQRSGHIVLLTGISGHIGTPGLGMYCASQWAIEGYCDSLAYEIAPFNIKLSILQSSIEVSILTSKITAVPAMEPYTSTTNPAPLARGVWSSILDKISESSSAASSNQGPPSNSSQQPMPSQLLNGGQIATLHPELNSSLQESLLAETIYAICAIAGHENPPSRHIVGHDGVASVKEKLRTVSEELEDFLEVSGAVDL